jgi:hypothetical protein
MNGLDTLDYEVLGVGVVMAFLEWEFGVSLTTRRPGLPLDLLFAGSQ